MNQMQMAVAPFTKMVKALVIANVAVWVLLILLPRLLVGQSPFLEWFALSPAHVISDFWIWQMFTYMFLHSTGVFHILFNMLVLWWFGAELEGHWGSRFFLTYYITCGIGAGIIYTAGMGLYYLFSGQAMGMTVPLVGASGATYGLLLAYGIIFSERILHFMMLFPMKAKWFVVLIGGVELLTMMDSGSESQVSNLAHLGGILVGFLFLSGAARWKMRGGGKRPPRGPKLKLVVDNERRSEPKYWN